MIYIIFLCSIECNEVEYCSFTTLLNMIRYKKKKISKLYPSLRKYVPVLILLQMLQQKGIKRFLKIYIHVILVETFKSTVEYSLKYVNIAYLFCATSSMNYKFELTIQNILALISFYMLIF